MKNRQGEEAAFAQLFKKACKKYFGKDLTEPLSETESKLFCIDIEEKTGLAVGFKSIKNYSIFITGGKNVRKENPSLATLDTLARYVLKAPITTEQERKRDENHYPYWHLYKKHETSGAPKYRKVILSLLSVVVAALIVWMLRGYEASAPSLIEEDFDDVSEGYLESNRWQLINKDQYYWDRRAEEKGFLRLFTLEGDNWPDSLSSLKIKNLMVRPIDAQCFDVEVRMADFIPNERWQQAGIILLEDTAFAGQVLRLSIAFNDYFGGFELPSEIVVQGITSRGLNNPEEVVHLQVFQVDSIPDHILRSNLSFCGLKIEKRKDKFRFLLANGSSQNMAYKEIGTHEFRINPKYIGIFAIKGNVKESQVAPVNFDSFKLQTHSCE